MCLMGVGVVPLQLTYWCSVVRGVASAGRRRISSLLALQCDHLVVRARYARGLNHVELTEVVSARITGMLLYHIIFSQKPSQSVITGVDVGNSSLLAYRALLLLNDRST